MPLHLIDKVEKELRKKKLEKCSDEYIIRPVVITVKIDNSIKPSPDSNELIDAIHKNKYQMQSIDHLMDTISKKISELKCKTGTQYFSRVDLKSLIAKFHSKKHKKLQFNIIGGNATGTYGFMNWLHGLTDMPATFQKAVDYTLNNINSAHALLDDKIIVTKGTLDDHET